MRNHRKEINTVVKTGLIVGRGLAIATVAVGAGPVIGLAVTTGLAGLAGYTAAKRR